MAGNTTCTAPNLTAGTYYDDIISSGNVSGSSFSQTSGTYTLVSLVAATPTPTPTPVPSPVPTFTPIAIPSITPGPAATINPLIVYQGKFMTTASSHPTTGCFELIATLNGAPLTTGLTTNAGAIGTINFDDTLFNENVLNSGVVTALSVTGLTSTGGSGSFTLADGTTGSIGITGSSTITSFLRHLPENRAAAIRHGLGL